ncbi:hypothetical protein [Dysgonomonas termitidis]|uniref:Transposase n=1 Tax=Dysgonomonas termitidis TaxID=1516126 RepID=A0ABV9KQJ4_9BACT
METNSSERSKSSLQMRAIEGYKECLKKDSYLSFKSYCRDNNIKYVKILDWAQRRGIFMRQLQAAARGEDITNDDQQTFIQFRPQSHPVMTDRVLIGVSITFPNNVNLTLQECTAESLISLLSLYHPEK